MTEIEERIIKEYVHGKQVYDEHEFWLIDLIHQIDKSCEGQLDCIEAAKKILTYSHELEYHYQEALNTKSKLNLLNYVKEGKMEWPSIKSM